jgi:hypothetical protein
LLRTLNTRVMFKLGLLGKLVEVRIPSNDIICDLMNLCCIHVFLC